MQGYNEYFVDKLLVHAVEVDWNVSVVKYALLKSDSKKPVALPVQEALQVNCRMFPHHLSPLASGIR
jgi:hypothetical protein